MHLRVSNVRSNTWGWANSGTSARTYAHVLPLLWPGIEVANERLGTDYGSLDRHIADKYWGRRDSRSTA